MSEKSRYLVTISFDALVESNSKKKAITEFMEKVLPKLYAAGDYSALNIKDYLKEDNNENF